MTAKEKIKRLFTKGIKKMCNPPSLTDCLIDSKSHICSGAQVNRTTMGKYSYIGNNSFTLNSSIGAFTSIGDNCRIGGATHPYMRVSNSPVFHKGRNCLKTNFSEADPLETSMTTVGSDVWIGADCIVISGVTIGNGAVVGAGSVVTHDIPPYEIWAGNPAHKIRDRFTQDIAEKMEKIQWWNWDDTTIRAWADMFGNPEQFIAAVDNGDAR